nr:MULTISPECIES: ubiquitin-like domain-containing protein [unclassified Schaalia]
MLSSRIQYGARTIRLAAIAAATAVIGTACLNIAFARTEVTLEVDGVTMPVTTWQPTTAGVLAAAGVELAERDLVQPALTQSLKNNDAVVVRTSHPYTLNIDGRERTVWSTASSAEYLLAESSAQGTSVSIAADRSYTRPTLIPLVSSRRPVQVRLDSSVTTVIAQPGVDARSILAASGVALAPNDRVRVASEKNDIFIRVERVERGEITRNHEVPFTVVEKETDTLFAGEQVVETAGVNGVYEQRVWRETIDGRQSHVAVLGEKTLTEPTEEVVLKGTKEVTPQALVAAGIDPKASLEEGTETDGRRSVRYRAKLGTISTKQEIKDLIGDKASPETVAAAMAAGVPLTYSGEDPRTLAQAQVNARGWDDSQFQCLVVLWDRESHWNPYAENSSSGAYGIPQSLPGSKMASAGEDWRTNPSTQIKWGLGYIAGRYGTPCGALGHSNSVGWY